MYEYSGGSVELLTIRRVDDDRSVAHVRVGSITIKSIWIVGLTTGAPRTSWPQTGAGYPIVEAEEPLKSKIDKLILDQLRDGIMTTPRKVTKARSPSPKPDRPFHDDSLDDLFPLGAG